jgi:hypothetical protein
MKKLFVSLFVALMVMVVPGFASALNIGSAWNIGYSYSYSNWDQNTGNVVNNVDSFHGVGVFIGSAEGSNYAGGQAITTHDNEFIGDVGVLTGGATQNSGQALGGFSYDLETGFLAGAIAGTKGDVSQQSTDGSIIRGSAFDATGFAGSCATQNSAAGFAGADVALVGFGNDTSGSFDGNSVIDGSTYSYSYKGINIDGNTGYETGYVGTVSGAYNSADTTITGNYGCGYAGGNGATAGQSSINSVNGSTHGAYAGHFSYTGNGSGSVDGSSVSTYTQLPYGGIVGTHTSINVSFSRNGNPQ